MPFSNHTCLCVKFHSYGTIKRHLASLLLQKWVDGRSIKWHIMSKFITAVMFHWLSVKLHHIPINWQVYIFVTLLSCVYICDAIDRCVWMWHWLTGVPGRVPADRWYICCEGTEEGCGSTGWGCRLCDDREAGACSTWEISIPSQPSLLLPNTCMFV